jgi:hypothetical protein
VLDAPLLALTLEFAAALRFTPALLLRQGLGKLLLAPIGPALQLRLELVVDPVAPFLRSFNPAFDDLAGTLFHRLTDLALLAHNIADRGADPAPLLRRGRPQLRLGYATGFGSLRFPPGTLGRINLAGRKLQRFLVLRLQAAVIEALLDTGPLKRAVECCSYCSRQVCSSSLSFQARSFWPNPSRVIVRVVSVTWAWWLRSSPARCGA